MKVTIEIPKEFEEHWKDDRFADSLSRLKADAHCLAGNYEKELVDMLIKAFNNAVDMVVEIKKEGEWEMFDLISSAYYGKGMYFKQNNGIVYSRYSGNYMSVDDAIKEFVSLIDGSNLS